MRDPAAPPSLRLAAAAWPGLRRHPALQALKPGRVIRRKLDIALVDGVGGELAAAGWLCLAEADAPRLVPLVPGLPDLVPPDIENLGSLAILARGRLEISTLPLAGGRALIFETWSMQPETARSKTVRRLPVLRCAGFTPGEAAALLLSLAEPGAETGLEAGAEPGSEGVAFGLLGADPAVALAVQLGLAGPRPVKAAELPAPAPDGDSAIALAAGILRHCLAQLDANIQPVLLGQDSEAVHQLRVALRRLRSALDIFAAILPAAWLENVVADLRWLNAPLGQRRDLDVFVEETLVPLRLAQPDLAGLTQLAATLEARRATAQAALAAALSSPRAALALLRLRDLAHASEAEWLRRLEPGQHDAALLPASGFAALSLQRRRRKLKQLGARQAELSVPELHRLRIRAKKLRYASDFFRPLFGKKQTKAAGIALARLQDMLGALNDAAVGDRLLAGLLGPVATDPAAAAIAGWFAARQATQLAQLGPAWADYAGLKPFWKNALPEKP